MFIFVKKLVNNNNSIYYLGYIFYGVSIVLMSIMIMMTSYLNLHKYNYTYLHDSSEKINSISEENFYNDGSRVANYNLIDEIETQTEKINKNFTTVDLKIIFTKYAYTIESVRENKLVPDISINKFPKDFTSIKSTNDKKSLFIKSLLPLIIKENNQILLTNNRIKKIHQSTIKYITKDNALWLKKQFKKYKVSSHDINDLLIKVDTIPVSIALAQAAIESGWGTSRFVTEGNALFGQWSWFKGSGIVPKDRDSKETYEIKSFESLRQSVAAYMKNLNSNDNYSEFRIVRGNYRENSNVINSIELLKYLSSYAENSEYSKILEKIIMKNNLQEFDEAKIYRLPYKVANLISN
jgi:Bax protein